MLATDVVVIHRAGQAVARSRNLRGILDYARKSYVVRAAVTRLPDGGAHIYVLFDNGAECRTFFASFTVAVNWIKARRSWALEACRCSDDYWTFYIPASDARSAH